MHYKARISPEIDFEMLVVGGIYAVILAGIIVHAVLTGLS